MTQIIYITFEQAIETHKKTVKESGGGLTTIINSDQLESVLESIQNDDYYPTLEHKLTHLMFGTCKMHCFSDGNKRIAIALGALFLILNGFFPLAGKFIHFMENISYHVAAGRIDKELLHKIICALMDGKEEEESLKLEIYNAIRDE